MATIRWKNARQSRVSGPVTIQVSRLELARYRDVPRFLWDALAIRRDVLGRPGAVGVSLRTNVWLRTFWTLSAWDNEEVLAQFVRSEIHRGVMKRYRGRMAGSHFHTWFSAANQQHRPSWSQAMERIEQA